MADYDFDLLVIGAGSGGVRAARVAAELGARVAVIESGKVGGTCVNAGCVPKKLLVYAAEFARAFADAPGYGYAHVTPAFDWPRLIAHKDREIARLNQVYERALQTAGVALLRGYARFEDEHTVSIGARRVSGRFILLAVGSAPRKSDIPGGELAITSDEVFSLARLPERVTLVGAGYIGLEFAGMFRALGAVTQLVHHRDQILSHFDHDVREHMAGVLRKQGMDVRCGVEVRRIERARAGQGLIAELSDGSSVLSDLVLFAIGRAPRTAGIGLPEIGIELDDDGAVRVDEYGRSSIEHVFAVGDCNGGTTLTPIAIAEGQAVARTMFGPAPVPIEHRNVPTAVFSLPAIAHVGMTEEEAREGGRELDVYRSQFTPLKHALSGRDEQCLVKLVVDRRTQRVLGCHMVGADAPEIIQGLAIAVHMGATKADFDRTLGLHPTAAEEFVTLRRAVR
jgi:glutathione reductase (NADPH)